ncbi:amylo-alpha-1,6-glucosidase [Phenylobacterium soli]|uniref:Amylo-alpha-1,6-glucosidase n=2 Tax=Phenylobacterium soli TaxID=2170551 RepID=A0A328AGX8_9CAUL|nr:amylo-alpha-1,6-glucosidase [Phenylobacterium soli]
MDDLDLAPGQDARVEWGQMEEPRVPARLHALKDHDTFVVADSMGDILGLADGLFHDDTRILSRWRLRLGAHSPTLLCGAVSQDNVFFTSHLVNGALVTPGGPVGPPGVLHVERKRLLWEERLFERITIVNYSHAVVMLPLAFEFDADFRDMFEVRGAVRPRRGVRRPVEVDERFVRFRYEGLDRVERSSTIVFSDPPSRLTADHAEFLYALQPDGRVELHVEIGAHGGCVPSRERFRAAAARARFAMRARRRRGGRLRTTGGLFNAWVEKSRADLALLTTPLQTGPYPYAGIPWFSTAFGRDAIITAWQILWFDPSLAKGVLTYLAMQQAEEVSAFRDSEPGKIMHETRRGEMAALGEVPFGRYYGGVDTTPLFVALAGAYAERTGSRELVDQLWPQLERAIAWVERRIDDNPFGLLAYAKSSEKGLTNQGWKDSGDSIFHADGRFPPPPIALVEVQGYAFAAFEAMAKLARQRGDLEDATRWTGRAETIRARVEELYWMEAEGAYGLAVDGDGKLARVRASNMGHLLFSGLPSAERAARVIKTLTGPDFASGWGLRTLAVGEARYNPMSYHNGSIWPHDTAICAMGMARYGERRGVAHITAGMFESAAQFEMRLPELFCGFPRCPGEPPVAYPVACLPQAWAAGAVFMMLQACLGVRVDGEAGLIEVKDPHLPVGLDHFSILQLGVGEASLDLHFERQGERIVLRGQDRRVKLG